MNVLTEDDLHLLETARAASEKAYCPHSHFYVGAAVETEIGVFRGCNIENDSYGLSMCAERVAIFTAVSAGAQIFTRLAVSCIDAAEDDSVDSKMPCGACRQVLAQFMPPTALVIIDGAGTFLLAELLPQPFRMNME